MLKDSVGEVVGDGAKQPSADDTVHLNPGRRTGRYGVGEDMVLQRVLAEDVEEGLLPASVEGGVDVEEQQNQGADVLDQDRLRIQVEEDRGLLLEQHSVEGKLAVLRGAVFWRRVLDARWLSCGMLASGAEARGSRIDLLLGGPGFAISLGCTRKGSIVGLLSNARVFLGGAGWLSVIAGGRDLGGSVHEAGGGHGVGPVGRAYGSTVGQR